MSTKLNAGDLRKHKHYLPNIRSNGFQFILILIIKKKKKKKNA
jgi:hypothetical protein